jgi:hypothetical protein
MTPRQVGKNIQWPIVVLSAVALVFLTLICAAPDAGAGEASVAAKTKFQALGTVLPSLRTCGTSGCDARKGHCECVEWDGVGQAQVSGLGRVKEVNVAFLINLDSCVSSPSLLFNNCCPLKGIVQFFKEPGPVAYNFNLSNGTVCESPDVLSYRATFQAEPSMAHSDVRNSGTVPSSGEFMGIPAGTDGHLEFFMR